MSFYLAIDAGGTKTDYVLANDSEELARARTGTIKRMRVDAETAAHNLDAGLRQISEQSGISMQSIARTCIGTAGQTVPLVVDWLRPAITSRVSGELVLVGDVEIALDAAFPGEAGILVLAGTGSNVAARTTSGDLITAGGWGPALADQGSGHRIGSESLRAGFLARDEGRPTRLLADIMEFWQLASLDRLVEHANRMPPPDVSKLVEIVTRAAQLGDAVAIELLGSEGEALAHLVLILIQRLRLAAGNPDWTPSLAFAGSILENVLPVRTALVNAVEREIGAVHTMAGVVDPLAGALWRARFP